MISPARRGRCTVLTAVPGVRAKRVAVVGLGKIGELDGTVYKKAVVAAIHALEGSKTRQILNTIDTGVRERVRRPTTSRGTPLKQ